MTRFEIKGRGSKNTATQAADEAYSIKRDINGEKYVEVEDDILDTNDGRSYAQIISDVIKNKYNGLVSANGQDIKLNAKTKNEWAYSNDAKRLEVKKYNDKLRSINNVDEILAAANKWINEESRHGKYPQYARGFVNFKVGKNGYTADVVVGISNDGSATLYDLVNIADKNIAEALNATVGSYASRRGSASVQS